MKVPFRFAVIAFCVSGLSDVWAQSSREQSSSNKNDSSHWWNQRREQYPHCRDLIDRDEELSRQVRAAHEKMVRSYGDDRKQLQEAYNDLVDRRGLARDRMYSCFGVRPPSVEGDPPPLAGGVSTSSGDVENEGGKPGMPQPNLKPGTPVLDGGLTIPGSAQDGGSGRSIPGSASEDAPQRPSPNDRNQTVSPQYDLRIEEGDDLSRPVFTYYYLNGINTPLVGPSRGNAVWDRKLIAANLLDLAPRMGGPPQKWGDYQPRVKQQGFGYETKIKVADEIDRLAPMTHNLSGLDGDDPFLLKGNSGGDLIECAVQAVEFLPEVGLTGVKFSAGRKVVDQAYKMILEDHEEEERTGQKRYTIIIAHSQGNFFGEGLAYRLFNTLEGVEIFYRRLGVLSIGSPTSYDSLPQWFRDGRIEHFTRKDDGILIIRQFPVKGKEPWPEKYDLAPMWDWTAGSLESALSLSGFPNPAVLDTMGLLPPTECDCPDPFDALYAPLLGSHLLENYLADPPMAEAGRVIHPIAASYYGFEDGTTTRANPVLGKIRFGLFNLKRELLRQE